MIARSYCDETLPNSRRQTVDQEKAFDRVKWNFFDRVSQRMNFGPEFRQWIRVIYTNMPSACLHSGFVTSVVEISRGVRQGDLLSSLLYTLVAEVLEVPLGIARISGVFARLVHLRSLKSSSMRTMET